MKSLELINYEAFWKVSATLQCFQLMIAWPYRNVVNDVINNRQTKFIVKSCQSKSYFLQRCPEKDTLAIVCVQNTFRAHSLCHGREASSFWKAFGKQLYEMKS